MAKGMILVVDDEEDILELVEYNLTRNGYNVNTVTTGEAALTEARATLPSLIILDLMLPGVDGLEVCKTLKNDPKTSQIPIIMLTAKGEEADEVTGLELSADDYVPKPFSPRVLLARVRSVLRRKEAAESDIDEKTLSIHNLTISPGRHEVIVDETAVTLTSTEFKLLQMLVKRPGWVFSRDHIIDNIHGMDYVVTDRSVDVLIVGLRKKLGASGRLIETVRGVGYRFKE